MRRKDREITDIVEIYKVIDESICCRIGFYDGNQIYIVPMNFGYCTIDNITTLYFHSAKEGRKISLIEKNKKVGFEIDTDYKLNTGEIACLYSARFKSIIGSGDILFVDDEKEKEFALQQIMYHNTKKYDWSFSEKMLDVVCIFKIVITSMSCKVHE